MLRLVGRRTMGQLTVYDLVIIIVLGSSVETAMVAGKTTLPAGLMCVVTLLLCNRLFTLAACRSRRFRHLVQGNPVLLVHFGHYIDDHLKLAGLTHADVLEAIRERGEAGPETVKFAVLEVDGTINVVPMDVPHRATARLRPGATQAPAN